MLQTAYDENHISRQVDELDKHNSTLKLVSFLGNFTMYDFQAIKFPDDGSGVPGMNPSFSGNQFRRRLKTASSSIASPTMRLSQFPAEMEYHQHHLHLAPSCVSGLYQGIAKETNFNRTKKKEKTAEIETETTFYAPSKNKK